MLSCKTSLNQPGVDRAVVRAQALEHYWLQHVTDKAHSFDRHAQDRDAVRTGYADGFAEQSAMMQTINGAQTMVRLLMHWPS